MPRCPNCGRETARTEDWACQYCGYPLPYGPFKKIAKKYHEIKGENRPAPPSEEPSQPAYQPPQPPVYQPQPEYLPPQPPPSVVPPKPVYPDFLTQPPPPARAPEPLTQQAAPLPPPPFVPAQPPVYQPQPEYLPPQPPQPPPSVVPPKPVYPEYLTPPPPVRVPEPPVQQAPPAPVAPVPPPVQAVLPPPAPPPALEPTTENLDVEKLFAVLAQNYATALGIYQEKVIKVRGQVLRTLISDAIDIDYLLLTSEKDFGQKQISCTFSKKQEAALSGLRPRDSVMVEGTMRLKYDGTRFNVLMKDCSLYR